MTTNGVFDFQPCDNIDGDCPSQLVNDDLFLPDNRSHRRTSVKHQVEICQQTVNPHCKVSLSDFDIVKCIGKGGYGKVYLVRKVSDGAHHGRLFAMKVLKKAVICRTEKDMVHTWSERNILEMIRHPFLVKLHYAFQNEANLNMILEYCPGGELFTYLESVGFVSEKKASFYIAEIVLAIGHLHSYGIIYRDLKPENILLDRHGHCKLTDFGLSKESCDRTNTYCGTKEYMAPEIWLRKYHDKNVDWWCLGNLLYDMLAGYPPFSNEDKSILREQILKENVQYPAGFSEETISLLDGLLQKDPSRRLGAGPKDVNLVKEHLFFEKYNVCWEDVLMKRLDPPYKPFLKSETDTSQFDENFTSMATALSPVDPVASDLFQGFSYVGSGVAESFLETRNIHEPRYRRRTTSNATSESSSASDSNDKYTGSGVHFNVSPGELSDEDSPFVREEDFNELNEVTHEMSRFSTNNAALTNGNKSVTTHEPFIPNSLPPTTFSYGLPCHVPDLSMKSPNGIPTSTSDFYLQVNDSVPALEVPSNNCSTVSYMPPHPQMSSGYADIYNNHSLLPAMIQDNSNTNGADLNSIPICIPIQRATSNGSNGLQWQNSQPNHYRRYHHHHQRPSYFAQSRFS